MIIWKVLVVMALPALLLWPLLNPAAFLDAVSNGWGWLRRRFRREATPIADSTVEQIASDLRRLDAYLDELEHSDLPARAARLQATSLAYDDVLLIACRTLEVPAPDRAPLGPIARLETEAALAQRGLVW